MPRYAQFARVEGRIVDNFIASTNVADFAYQRDDETFDDVIVYVVTTKRLWCMFLQVYAESMRGERRDETGKDARPIVPRLLFISAKFAAWRPKCSYDNIAYLANFITYHAYHEFGATFDKRNSDSPLDRMLTNATTALCTNGSRMLVLLFFLA